MVKTLLIKLRAATLLLWCLFCFGAAMGQTATFNYLSGGLGGTSLTAGNSQVPIYGFSVGVSGGGSITFRQYNLSFAQTSQNYFANGTLYRSSTNSFNSGSPGTPVGNVVFNGNDVTLNNFSETITSGSTNYYFLVLDVIYTSGGNGNFYANTANFATDSNGGTNYPFYSTYRFMSFTAGTPYPVRVAFQNTDLASTATVITSGTTDHRLFEFSVTTSSSHTFSSFKINSNQGTLSNYLTNIRLYGSTTNTFPGGSPIATGTISGSYVNFNSISQSVSSTTKYYWIVADCSITGSVPVNVQFNMANGQTNASVTASSPSATYNQFTVYGQTYNINNASLAVTSQQNGLASTTIYPAETGKAVFGFGVSATVGTPTINQININSNNSSLSTYYGNVKLYRSTTNNYSTGTLTLLGSGSISGAFVSFTGLSETMSGTAKYYFLVVDVTYSGGGTNSTAFNFTSGQASAAFVQTSPSTSFNTFNVTGTTFNIAQAIVNVTSNTNGVTAAGALTYGQTALPVYGFNVAVTGGTTVNSFTIAANGIPAALASTFANAKLYKSSTNSYTGTLTQVGTVNFSGTNIVITGINDSFTNTTRSYFLVVDVVYYGTSGYFQPVATSITTAGSTSLNLYQNYYSFAVPPPSFALTGNNSAANGITQGVLQYGQTGIVLFGFKLDVMGTTSISQFNIPSTGTSNTFFNSGGTLYRSTTPNFSIATSTAVNTGALSWQSAYVSIPVNESFSTNTSLTTYYYFLVADYNNINASSSGTIKYGFSTSQSPVAIWYTGGLSTSPSNVTDGQTFNVGLTYDWVGITSNSFTATGNYRNLNNGGVGTAPGQYDQVRIGVVAYQGSANQPTISSDVNISKLWFGPNNTPTLTLGNGDALTVSDGIVLSNSTTATITGGNNGSDLTVSGGTSTIPSGSTLNITIGGDFSNAGILNNAGTLAVGTNAANSGTFSQTGTAASTYTGTFGNTGTFSNASSGTTTFTDVLTNSSTGTIQVSNGTINITNNLANNGAFTASGGTINFADDFTNSSTGTFTATGGTAVFNRSGTQAISNANTTTPVTFNNLTVSGSNTKTLSGTGTFAIKSSGVVTMAGTATLASAGKLTLRSDITGSAAVAAIPTGAGITGAVTVQRYVSGGTAAYRGYRLFSSPVYEGAAGGNNVYGVAYTKNSAYLTGTSGTGGGFDATSSTPTIYLYREDKAPSSSATGGNFRGINKINNSPTYNLNLDNETGIFNIPVGNGFMFFFRGDRATNASTSTSVIPDPVAFSNTGTLNQGTIVVKNWYTPGSSNLGYTPSASLSSRGYNLVGNPYASTIDWGTFSNSNSASGIYGPNIANATYIYNAATKSYAVWNGVSGTNGASRYIPSGQGFYVLATGASPSLNFKEIAKVPTQQVTGFNLLMGAPVEETVAPQYLRLQLIKDAVATEDAILQFNKSATENYILGEDLPYMRGSNAVSFSTFATDNRVTSLAINQIPLPKKGVTIPLNVLTNATGVYQIVLAQDKNIPKMFDYWLIDANKRDTIDIKNTKTYSFNINTADATTFGSERFKLVVRTNADHRYKLLDFEAIKKTTSVQLRWNTANEENYTYFTVERSTDGGKSFDVIGSEVAKGLGSYSLIDKNPVNGENLYRLKQEDYFGTITYSKIVQVTYTSAKDATNDERIVSVYPNPSSVDITISVKTTDKKATNYAITITNTSGRVVKTIQSSQPDWTGNISDLLPGTYFIRVINSNDSTIVGDSTFIKI